jgi:hypothetical protein
LVEAGFNVHGVDASAAMLASCAARLAALHHEAKLFRQDIGELNLPLRYGAAFVAAGSFQLLTDPSRARAALEHVRTHLVEPGILLLDLYVPSTSVQRIAAPLVEFRNALLADGSRIALRSETTMHPEARLARTASRYVHRRGNDLVAEENETLVVTWYEPEEIAALVTSAGYRDATIGPPACPPSSGTGFSLTARA